jgi:hypothetical protein
MRVDFTGAESPTDVLNAVVADFSLPPAEIVHEDGVAYLAIQSDIPTDYTSRYRLDKLLLPVFSRCEAALDHNVSIGFVQAEARDYLARVLAYVAMTNFLTLLVVRHVSMFRELDKESNFIADTILFQSLTKAHSKPHTQDKVSRTLSSAVRQALDNLVKGFSKERRNSLAEYLNRLPLLIVPMGEGRPPGSKKPEEKKQREAVAFEKKIEEAILNLFEAKGTLPTKTEVAEALGMGGVNPRKGTDSRLNTFNNKLANLKIDYAAIIQRLDLHK